VSSGLTDVEGIL